MPNFSPQQQAFISTYSALTGLHPGVVSAQVAAEEPVGATSGYHGTQDWLNVGITDSGPMGASNPAWKNPVQAAKLAAAWATGKTAIPGFGHASSSIVNAIRNTAGKSPQAQIAALQRSGWASSGYPNLPQLFNAYGSNNPKSAGSINASLTGLSPTPRSSSPQTTSTTKNVFDQQGFKQAQDRYIAGSFLQQSAKTNPYGNTSPSPLLSSGLLTTKAPDPADYQSQQTQTKTIQGATSALQQLAGTGLVNVHPNAKGYVNPIPGAVIGRTDMGVDANLKPGAPILAIGDSKVVGISPNWYKGQPYVQLQLLNGPQAGKTYYVAEQIAPSVKAGQMVKAGQPIGRYASSGTGIEIGWGSPQLGRTQAQATTGYSEGQVTPAGASFRSFLGGLK